MNISFLAIHSCDTSRPCIPHCSSAAEPLSELTASWEHALGLVQTFPQLYPTGLGHSLPLEHVESFIPVEYHGKIPPGGTYSLLASQTTAFISSLQDITCISQVLC